MNDDQEACGSCRYFRLAEGAITMGACYINPPTTTGWPLTHSGDWCGDYATELATETERLLDKIANNHTARRLNAIHAELRIIRDSQEAMREDIREIKGRIAVLEAAFATLSAAYDGVSSRLDRIEQRLGLVEA